MMDIKEMKALDWAIKKHERDARTYGQMEFIEGGTELKKHWKESKERESQYAKWLNHYKLLLERYEDEHEELIRCGECRWWGRVDKDKDGLLMTVCAKGYSADPKGHCHHAERRKRCE